MSLKSKKSLGVSYEGNTGSLPATHAEDVNNAYPRSTTATSRKLRAQFLDCSLWPERVLFLDVETTGLNPQYDKITVMGWSFGGCASTLIAGQDPRLLREDVARANALVTFNGGLFDLKFIRREHPEIVFPRTHIDLMYLCRRIGLRGGQKSIENALGIDLRGDESQMDGADAVVLWHKYTHGDRDALRKLVLYNRADVAAIGAILDQIVDQMNLRSDLSLSDVRFRDWSAPPGWQTFSGVSWPVDGG